MPVLPDATSLGRVSPSGGRAISDPSSAFAGAQDKIVSTAARSGAGLEHLGRGISEVGRAVGNIAEEQQAAQRKLEGAWADTNFFVANAKLKQSLANERDFGAIDQYKAKYQEAFDGVSNSIADKGQQELWRAQNDKVLQSNLIGVDDYAHAVRRDNFLGGLPKTISDTVNAAAASNDPKVHAKALADIGRLTAGAVENGYINAEQKGHIDNEFAKNLSVNTLNNLPPAQRLSVLSPIVAGDAAKTGFGFFTSQGWTPEQSAGIMGHLLHESGGKLDPNAINPGDGADGSDSIGIGQWNGERAKALKSFAASQGKPWNDLGVQLQFVQYELGTSEGNAAAALKGAKSVDEATAAFLRYERPKGWQGGLNTAHGGFNRLRSARSVYGQLHEGAILPDTRMAEILPPKMRVDMASDAERQIIQDQRLSAAQRRSETVTVNSLIKDDTASIMQTGKEVSDLSTQRVAEVLGPERAAEFDAERGYAKDFYTQTHDFLTLPTDQLDGRIEALRPVAGSPGFAQKQKYFEAASKQMQEIVKQRTDDPAAAADQLDALKPFAAQASFDNPDSYKPLVGARLSAQDALGIPEAYRSPITKAEALELWNTVRFAPADRQPDAVKEVVRTVERSFGEYSDQALGAMLRYARVDKATREQAAIVLKRIAHDQPATVQDARSLDAAQVVDASQKTASAILPSEEDIPESAAVRAMNAPNYPSPSDKAIEALRDDPGKASSFDQKFGPGAAQKFLKLYGG